jgi:hypothetical protein
MDADEAIKLAAQYLADKNIGFSEPVHVIAAKGPALEVVFTAPGALDPNLVVDPPDIRVLVRTDSSQIDLVLEM